MSIKININIDWEKTKRELIREIDERVLVAFERASLKAVTWAKENKGYTVRTGSLSSSTGYQLYKGGVLISEMFKESATGTDKDGAKTKGVEAGKQAASSRAAQLGSHICAVIVAGMPYAVYVEQKGFDVLTGAEHQFPAILEEEMRKAFAKSTIPYSITAD
jgi:hypothetical protein